MNNKKIYAELRIKLILFYTFVVAFVPIVLVISYIFDFTDSVTANRIVLYSGFIDIIIYIVGSIWLVFFKKDLKRKLKPSYLSEFGRLFIISVFGLIGVVVLYTYYGGNTKNIPHILMPSSVMLYFILYKVGKHYFNIDLLKK